MHARICSPASSLFLAALLFGTSALAQSAPPAADIPSGISSSSAPLSPVAPPPSAVPTQIAEARAVFLTNMGADPNFPIDNVTAYNDVYRKLQAWGHYRLVGSPAEAELVLQLRDLAPISGVGGTEDGIYSITSPAFQLTILDAKLNQPLYTVTSPVIVRGRKQARAHWTDVAEDNLVSRLKVLAHERLSPAESANLITAPKDHTGRTVLIVTGALVAVGVGGGLLIHHLYENSLADQKSQQDAFCKANNIPLSMCAGG